jgi:hypothetical protein
VAAMPTAVWTGTLSFGLVAIPVRLVPAAPRPQALQRRAKLPATSPPRPPRTNPLPSLTVPSDSAAGLPD